MRESHSGARLALGAILVAGTTGLLVGGAALSSPTAHAAVPVADVPGLAGPGLNIVGVARLSSGGALVAASVDTRGRGSRTEIVVARLLVDGTIDLTYGNNGVVYLELADTQTRATAIAVDPSSSRAWIGATVGPHADGAIVALNGVGRRVARFGSRGVLNLGPTGAGGPSALAFSGTRLLVAAGATTATSCRGCDLRLIGASSGRPVASATLTTTDVAGGASCPGTGVSSATLTRPGFALLATDAGPQLGCTAQVVVRGPNLGALPAGSLNQPAALTPRTSRALLAAAGSQLCLATQSPAETTLSSFALGRPLGASSPGPPQRLVSVVALGANACAALVTPRNGRGGTVVEARAGEHHPARIAVQADVVAQGMFRCHQHLLVVGAQGAGARRAGLVAVVRLLRGARTASASSVARAAPIMASTAAAERCH